MPRTCEDQKFIKNPEYVGNGERTIRITRRSEIITLDRKPSLQTVQEVISGQVYPYSKMLTTVVLLALSSLIYHRATNYSDESSQLVRPTPILAPEKHLRDALPLTTPTSKTYQSFLPAVGKGNR